MTELAWDSLKSAIIMRNTFLRSVTSLFNVVESAGRLFNSIIRHPKTWKMSFLHKLKGLGNYAFDKRRALETIVCRTASLILWLTFMVWTTIKQQHTTAPDCACLLSLMALSTEKRRRRPQTEWKSERHSWRFNRIIKPLTTGRVRVYECPMVAALASLWKTAIKNIKL